MSTASSGDERDDEADTRMPPDPFSVVLPALGALGAIASIAAINWAGQEKSAVRTRAKRKTSALLKDLETCCIGLVDVFRRLRAHPRIFAGEGGVAAAPMKFGVHAQRVRADAQRLYLNLVSDIASKYTLAMQSAFDVMTAIEDGEIDAPEEIYFGLGEQQERLNELLQSRPTLKVAVDTGAEVADRLLKLVAELKTYQTQV